MEELLKQIEAIIGTKLKHEPGFTGSLSLTVNFQNGVPGDIVKEFEKSRERVYPRGCPPPGYFRLGLTTPESG
jgi:hypothetical protein